MTQHTEAPEDEDDLSWWTQPMSTKIGAAIKARYTHPDTGRPHAEAGFSTIRGTWLLLEQIFLNLRNIEASFGGADPDAATAVTRADQPEVRTFHNPSDGAVVVQINTASLPGNDRVRILLDDRPVSAPRACEGRLDQGTAFIDNFCRYELEALVRSALDLVYGEPSDLSDDQRAVLARAQQLENNEPREAPARSCCCYAFGTRDPQAFPYGEPPHSPGQHHTALPLPAGAAS